jgi:hypothetical protein
LPAAKNATTGSRAVSNCDYDYWSNTEIVGLSQPASGRASSFAKCAFACCKDSNCAVFEWRRATKTCYRYNNVYGDLEDNNLEDSPGWTAGALTIKNGTPLN